MPETLPKEAWKVLRKFVEEPIRFKISSMPQTPKKPWSQVIGSLREALGIEAPKAKQQRGLVAGATSVYEKTWGVSPVDSWENFERIYKTDGFVNAAVEQTVAETIGSGFYTTIQDENSEEAKKTKDLVDAFCAKIGLDQILIQSCRDLLVVGNAFLERVFDGKKLIGLEPRSPTTMRVMRDEHGMVLGYLQKVGTNKVAFTTQEILHLKFCQLTSSAYGTGLVASVYFTIADLNKIDDDMTKIIKRYGAPKIVWKLPSGSSDEYMTEFQASLENVGPDQDFISTQDVAHEVIAMDPRGRFDNYISLLNEKVQSGLKTPLLSYLRNATEASAKVMLDYYQQHVAIIQRYLKRAIETEIFKVFLEGELGEVGPKAVPKVNWGMPRTGLEDIKIGDIAGLVQTGTITPNQAQNLLRRLGVPLESETVEAVKT